MRIIVQKYGGTSIASTERIQYVAEKIAGKVLTGQRLVVVVSAMGDSTDRLMGLAHKITSRPDPRELDMLLATGEQVSVSLLAMALKRLNIDAVSLTGWQAGILTDHNHGEANIRHVQSDKINAYLEQGKVVIVAGFQGVSEQGDITTIGRGGSDTTAVMLAAALHAERCEIYTDVDAVYTADPRAVPDARPLKHISYDEMLALANSGAKVLHVRAVEAAQQYDVMIQVKSSFSEGEGTLISSKEKALFV